MTDFTNLMLTLSLDGDISTLEFTYKDGTTFAGYIKIVKVSSDVRATITKLADHEDVELDFDRISKIVVNKNSGETQVFE